MLKTSLESLAIFGGTAAFTHALHVGRPNIGRRERLLERIDDLLDRRWLTNQGPYVQEFERRVTELIQVKHCIAMCNGTIALEIASRALGLSGEVIVPSFTFIATAHALQWQNITPIFCDIDPHTHGLEPCEVEQMITPATTGILAVHLWGRPCNVGELSEIARRYNLKLLFDGAQAFGCSHNDHMIGNFGDAEVFSFHATKVVNTFEGGAVVTNDDELAEMVRLMQNFGFTGYDQVVHVGTNGKMSEVAAAMGIASLESLDEFIEVNLRNYKQYQQHLGGIPGIDVLTYDETQKCNFHYIVIDVDEAESHISRDEIQFVLWAENVLARRYFYPGCHRMEPYRSCPRYASLSLPNTESLAARALCLPTGTSVVPDEIAAICQIIRTVVRNGREACRKLRCEERDLRAIADGSCEVTPINFTP